MSTPSLKRSFLQRIFGIPATTPPRDADSWEYLDGEIVLQLARAPELTSPGGGVRLEGKGLPHRILIVRGEDGSYHAFKNRCRHMGRRVDPVPGAGALQCCSVSKATYDLDGNVVSGPARGPLTPYPVEIREEALVVRVH